MEWEEIKTDQGGITSRFPVD